MKFAALGVTAAIVSSSLLMPSAEAADFEWSDTYVSLDYVYHGRNPGSAGYDNRAELNIAHADGWTYGSNFVGVTLKQHSKADQTNNALGGQSGQGAGEFYGIFRTVLSGNKIFGTQMARHGTGTGNGAISNARLWRKPAREQSPDLPTPWPSPPHVRR